jgi:hypothetical protein
MGPAPPLGGSPFPADDAPMTERDDLLASLNSASERLTALRGYL